MASKTDDDLLVAREVILAEARAIEGLARRLDEGFPPAVEAILSCQGRVVTTGMGKAGIIARKLSATLASTGTPSIYLHPAEAIHGDLGRIVPEDIVIALSSSGDTEEVIRLIPSIRRLGVRLLAMTGNRESSLGREADIVIDTGRIVEACPHDLAPTASTAVLHALGDALAICVMRRRGFSREQYAQNHPGGSLGRRLMRTRDIMRTGERFPTVLESATLHEAVGRVTQARAGAVVVVDERSRVVGIVTDGDIRRHLLEPGIIQSPVSSIMTRDPITIGPDHFALEAAELMRRRKVDDLPVVDDQGRGVGIVDLQDLMSLHL